MHGREGLSQNTLCSISRELSLNEINNRLIKNVLTTKENSPNFRSKIIKMFMCR